MAAAPTNVDVLIIGAGPSGLALANWLRNCDINVLLIDKKPGPTARGQAEGLKSTTVEMLESFGIGHDIASESWRLEEIAIWGQKNGGDTVAGGIAREQVMQDKVEELGKPRETMLQQSRVEHHMLQNLSSSSNIKIQWSTAPVSLDISTSEAEYPVAVALARTGEDGLHGPNPNAHVHGGIQELRTRYVVGSDGAHSWLRSQLGVTLEGDVTDSVFGVVDMVPKSNFPDIRKVCYLRAATGTILLVPRSGKEVRLYIPVESGSSLSDPKGVTFERIMDAARKIIFPYTLEVGSTSWWSAYRVGQRVGSHFSKHDRAFLVGDAVHTHSPKAGQGMNTSIQDAYNLGWKLLLVLQGRLPPAVLGTYESERRPVAQNLIDFDRGYLKLFEEPSAQFETDFLRGMKFTTGLSIRYAESCIVRLPRLAGKTVELGPSLLKADLVPGKRLPDFQAVYQADGTTTRIHPRLQATGPFRVLVFAGDIARPDLLDRLRVAGNFLGDAVSGLGHVTSGGSSALVEVLVIHCAKRDEVELLSLPCVFRPWSETEGYDYWRVLADVESAHEGHGRAYERLEIARNKGCTVVVRPDGYVGALLDVVDLRGLRGYFEDMGMMASSQTR
ncbi:hypothetical protein G6O67_004477 [Ophiocordyceps sinensis]|uniref:Phenol 2-monooxygenase n=1 Tax=Ophiocordyceps sinensis TaxID=72228 RepID=A0A8H4PPI0_9HYPO|nr:hypothetical protein G6O67_004477 [Ophiocordyceps sinensis]